MPTGIIQSNAQIAGLSIGGTLSRTADAQIGLEIALPAGTAGTSENRIDADTGDVDLDPNHGLENGDTVDVYWDGGMRYGMGATVVVDIITLDGGSGDDLPANDTAMVVTLQVEVNVDFDGDDVQLVVAQADQRASLDFQDSGDASLEHIELETAGEQWFWAADQGDANPLTGNPVDTIHCTNGNSSTAAILKIGVLYDSTV